MKDYILRATAGGGSVRIFAASTRNLVNDAARLHGTTPVASAALGRLLTAAAMMGATLKNETDLLTLDMRGSGPIGGIVAVANSSSQVKGYAINPHVQLQKNSQGKLDVGGALGIGVLTVTKDMGLKEPFSGQVELVSGEVVEDITYYFATSEQTPSSVALGVLVDIDYSIKQAGGFIVQLLPGASDEVVNYLEAILSKLPPVTTMLESGSFNLDTMFAGLDVDVLDTVYPQYHCNCSRQKTFKALATIPRYNIEEMFAEDGQISMHCHFCNADYCFTVQDF